MFLPSTIVLNIDAFATREKLKDDTQGAMHKFQETKDKVEQMI